LRSGSMEAEQVDYFSDGEAVSGWFYSAARDAPVPALVFCAGYTGTKYAGFYQPYVESFVRAGYSVLLFDYRGWGDSGGIRGEILPLKQVADVRSSLTYLETRADVDAERLGLFGVSYGGGIVSYAAGLDKRVQCTVSVSGVADGASHLRLKRREYEWQEFLARLGEARHRWVLTGETEMVKPIGDISIPTPERASANIKRDVPADKVPDQTPLYCVDAMIDFRPIDVVARISPRAILWFYVDGDTAVPPDHSRAMYVAAEEPKRLVRLRNSTHYGAYLERFDTIVRDSIDWFDRHISVEHPTL
jgi:dipeptidyl aminopeptidase/acylaminoacyl peptidase